MAARSFPIASALNGSVWGVNLVCVLRALGCGWDACICMAGPVCVCMCMDNLTLCNGLDAILFLSCGSTACTAAALPCTAFMSRHRRCIQDNTVSDQSHLMLSICAYMPCKPGAFPIPINATMRICLQALMAISCSTCVGQFTFVQLAGQSLCWGPCSCNHSFKYMLGLC